MIEYEIKIERAFPLYPSEKIKIDFCFADSISEAKQVMNHIYGEMISFIYVREF